MAMMRFLLATAHVLGLMSTWRREALHQLPELRAHIEGAAAPMDMWIRIDDAFNEAFTSGHKSLVQRVLEYAAWCISEKSGSLPNAASSAAAVGFYENLPLKREYWPLFPSWFTPSEFAKLIPVFAYTLEPQDLEELQVAYTKKQA